MDTNKKQELIAIARDLEGIAMLIETREVFKILCEPIRDEVDKLRRGVRAVQKPRNAA